MRKILKTSALAWAFGAAAFVAVPAASASDFDALLQTCAACHGVKGDQPLMPAYPILSGQYANYTEHALKAYRSGERRNAVMNAQAANLSDAEIRALSRYYARQETPLYTPAYR